jgi:Ca-activated chloride channel family protein
MATLIARPQWGDTKSHVDVEGIDIMLAIDISGSMQLFDDLQDRRSRIEVAKQEAINFIKNRPNDPIGIIVFGADTLSVAPPTLDKTMLTEAVKSLRIGFVNENGTALEQGLATAVARLRSSKTKNPIIILLTDGQPTGHSAVSIDQALAFAKEYIVKVYTIGIGRERGGYIEHYGRVFPQQDSGVDKALLPNIAQETGGHFFMAQSPEEMRQIYAKINELEKTKQTVELFSTYYEAFWHCMIILLCLLALETGMALFVWRGITW